MKTLIVALMVITGMLSINGRAFAQSGHEAGYEWAAQHDITDTDYSNGNSNAFNEGAREYAEENQ